MKKNKTVPQLIKEIENIVPISYLGPDGSRRRIVHPSKAKLLEKLSNPFNETTFINSKIKKIDSYSTEYNSLDFDNDLKDYYENLVESMAVEYNCSKSTAYEYLKAIVEYILEHALVKTIAGKMRCILRGTKILFNSKIERKVRITEDNRHYLSDKVVLAQKEYYEKDSNEWSSNDLRVRFDVIKFLI